MELGAGDAGILRACRWILAFRRQLHPATHPRSQASDAAWTNWLKARAAAGASWDELQVGWMGGGC